MPRLSKIGAAALAAFGWTSGSAVSASYLVVAGGGGGGKRVAGAGGAGGLLTGTASLNPTLSYTITVGAGGAGSSNYNSAGTNGSDSIFNTATSIGGGGGAGSGIKNGVSGGSGGGSSDVGTVGTGTVGQGNNGGVGSGTASAYGGGGGGGASAVGGNGSSTVAGSGGAGTASSISGSSVTYAGGGGGGSNGGTAGTGGSGGGGAGTTSDSTATAGTANLGGGGGGCGGLSTATGTTFGGQGGSGIVIISYVGAQQFSGGVVTSSGGNTIHTFTTSGTLAPVTPLSANYLVVAGGAGGGGIYGGGGGAGGLKSGSGLVIDPYSIYLVTVGAGGAGGAAGNNNGVNGSDSVFNSVTSLGGGYGGADGQAAGAGGSGGGASGTNTVGAGTSGQGNNGGQGFAGDGATQTGGGGGGAGAVGATSTTSRVGGNGGTGSASSISGASVTYAGGGGGGTGTNPLTSGLGGSGGGGNANNAAAGSAGTANLGGGGGGGGRSSGGTNFAGGAGGSGVVIISYAGATQLMAGGVVTIAGGNVIHTFNSSGYLTPLTLLTRSLRFRSSATAYLSRTYATPTSTTIATISFWYKRGLVGNSDLVTAFGTVSTTTGDGPYLQFTTNGALRFVDQSSDVITSAFFRDPAAWYHFVLAIDTTQATAANRLKFYVNGVQITSFSSATYGAQNYASNILAAGTQYIGYSQPSNARGSDGYMAEVNFIDGQALAPTAFGTVNSYGVWQPITYGGSYGANGFRLPFTNNASTTTLGYDFSPQGNNWTTNNISVTAGSTYDSMTDVPTLTSATAANFATWNPLVASTGNISSGNLNVSTTVSSATSTTLFPSTGKWYWETVSTSGTAANTRFGICNTSGAGADLGGSANGWAYLGDGRVYNNGSTTSYGVTYTTNDILMIALDLDAGKVWYGKNGTWMASGSPSTGANPSQTFTANQLMSPAVASGTGTLVYALNCGQQPFTYTPPSGYLALNTFNI